MRRRDVLRVAAGAAILAPAAGKAQPADRIRRIGYLTPAATGSPEDSAGVLQIRALVEGLRALGWSDGRNITIEHRFSGTGNERIRASAKELVALKPDAIVSVGGRPLAALLAETQTIPIVFTVVSDPVGSGFVASLARPAGNATGFAVQERGIAGKWLELLKEIAPHITRALVIMEADNTPQTVLRDAVTAAAPALNIALGVVAAREPGDIEQAIVEFARQPGGGLVVFPNPVTAAYQRQILDLAAQYRLPAVYSYPSNPQRGGLISYGTDPVIQLRDAAGYVDKILRGVAPGDLPVQQPTIFRLVINLNTARALGLTVPQSLLARADEVIE